MSFEFTSELAPVDESIAAQDPGHVLDAVFEALRFELAHAEASRSRAAGLLTAAGVLLALTVSLSTTASTAVSHLTHIGKPVVIIAAALASLLLLAAGVLAGHVFAPTRRTRTPVEEMRELSELRFRESEPQKLVGPALWHLSRSRQANLRSRVLILWAMGLYICALAILGAQVLLIAVAHLAGF